MTETSATETAVAAGPVKFVVEHRTVGAGSGPTIRVVGADDSHEYLRFDMFSEGPHYHYSPPKTPDSEATERILKLDTVADGEAIAWAITTFGPGSRRCSRRRAANASRRGSTTPPSAAGRRSGDAGSFVPGLTRQRSTRCTTSWSRGADVVGPDDALELRIASAASKPSTVASTCSMSSQSLGRSNTALHTTRCSGARIGIVSGPNGPTACPRASPRGARRRRRTGRSACDPIGTGPVRHGRHRAGERGRVDTEGAERGGDVVGVIDGDEDVHVDVDRGARLGVVRERERATECVRDTGACSAWCSATTLSGSDGSVTAGVAAPAIGRRAATGRGALRPVRPGSRHSTPPRARTESDTPESGSTASESAAASVGDGWCPARISASSARAVVSAGDAARCDGGTGAPRGRGRGRGRRRGPRRVR